MRTCLTFIGWLWAISYTFAQAPSRVNLSLPGSGIQVALNHQTKIKRDALKKYEGNNTYQVISQNTRAKHRPQMSLPTFRGNTANKSKYQKETSLFTWLGVLALLTLVLGVALLYRKQHNTNRQLDRMHTKIGNEQEKLLGEIRTQKQQLGEEFLAENQRLIAHSLFLIQKNQVLQKVRQLARQASRQQASPDVRNTLDHLDHLVNHGLNLDSDREYFHAMFEQLHAGFYKQLKAKYPLLTQNDLFFCALLKLNPASEEIAGLLGITKESLKIKRYRLRQKMNLGSDEGLREAMCAFDSFPCC